MGSSKKAYVLIMGNSRHYFREREREQNRAVYDGRKHYKTIIGVMFKKEMTVRNLATRIGRNTKTPPPPEAEYSPFLEGELAR